MQYSKKWLKIALVALPGLVLTVPEALAQKASATKKQSQGNFADGIAAIVNTDVITQRELTSRMSAMRVSGNPQSQEAVLSILIDEHLMNEQAKLHGIRITSDRLQQALTEIAAQNGMTLAQLQAAAKQYGIKWDEYTDNISQQLRMDELRSRVVQSRVHVSEFDVDAFLRQHPTGMYPEYKQAIKYEPRYEKREVVEHSFDPKAIAFQHIFVRVPDNSPPDVVEAARNNPVVNNEIHPPTLHHAYYTLVE